MTETTVPLAPAATPAHILVVDDVEKNTRLLADLLGARGYRTSTAASGAQALAQIDAMAPDLVLLDVMMPGMSGYEVCQKLRADPRHELLPVVLVTALDPAVERVKGLDAGADDFLTKPINQAELLARVRSLLRVKALQDQLFRERPAVRSPPGTAHRSDVVVLCMAWPGLTGDGHGLPPEALLVHLQALQTTLVAQIRAHQGTLSACHAQGMTVLFNDPVPQPDASERALHLAQGLLASRSGVSVGVARGPVSVGPLELPGGGNEYAALGPAVLMAAMLSCAARPDEVLASADLAADWGDAAQPIQSVMTDVNGRPLPGPIARLVVRDD